MAVFGIGKKDVASVAVPGEVTVSLPAGKVKLRYVEDRAGRSTQPGSKRWPGPDESLDVTVTADGAAVSIEPGKGVREGMSPKSLHREIGSIELESPATCSVVVAMAVGESHRSPRITFRA